MSQQEMEFSGKSGEVYPSHKLKRVPKPTTRITGKIAGVDEREHGFNRALRGDFGQVVQKERAKPAKYPLLGSLTDMQGHLIDVVDGPIKDKTAPISEDPKILSKHIKELTYFLRADAVGICELPSYAVYTHDKQGNPIDLKHKHAIAILIDQNYKSFHGATGFDWISSSKSYMGYSASGFIACILANYIRRLGFPARAHHARDYQVLVPPILLWAGLGEMCRIGDIVVNPFLGPRFKAAVVTTDLPLLPDQPIDFGLQEFCRVCKKCARECPSGAISSGEKEIYNGYETWKADTEKCTKFRITNQKGSSCGRCIKVCPWNKPDAWYHRIGMTLAQKSAFARQGLIWLDDVLGYGKQSLPDKWWFDLEEVDGQLVKPAQNKIK